MLPTLHSHLLRSLFLLEIDVTFLLLYSFITIRALVSSLSILLTASACKLTSSTRCQSRPDDGHYCESVLPHIVPLKLLRRTCSSSHYHRVKCQHDNSLHSCFQHQHQTPTRNNQSRHSALTIPHYPPLHQTNNQSSKTRSDQRHF